MDEKLNEGLKNFHLSFLAFFFNMSSNIYTTMDQFHWTQQKHMVTLLPEGGGEERVEAAL